MIMEKTMFTAVSGKQDVVVTRVFDAPREAVFAAFTDPDLVPQWWGPRNLTTAVDAMDVRPGGIWRFINRDAQGREFAFHGVFHEVVPFDRVVYTFEYEGAPGHVVLETVTFAEHAGKTTMTEHAVFQTVADRDGMLTTGMERGAAESMDRMAELLAKSAAAVGVR
jgi:uncharacterized protein YndB with AHSA1/START domain